MDVLNSIGLVVCALLPAIALLIYIFKKDRAEKEPVGLILLLFFAGVLITWPTAFVEDFLDPLIDNIFVGLWHSDGDMIYLDTIPAYIHSFLEAFFGVALIEEGFKFLALFLLTHKNKNFNSLFDGMIYAVAVSLGFAALENILYAFSFGWSVVFNRMILSVPAHMFFGVLMGYFYSFWNVFRHVDILEQDAKQKGMILPSRKPIRKSRQLALALVIPVIAHGIFDFCLFIETDFLMFVFYVFVVFLYVFCFLRVRSFSKSDVPYGLLLMSVFLKRNPDLLKSMSAVVGSSEIQKNFESKDIEMYKNILNTYYMLTFDADPKKETSLEALMQEASE